MLTLFAKLAMLGLSSVGAFDRTPYPLHTDSLTPTSVQYGNAVISALACYIADNGTVVCYDPADCPDPSSPDFDYCTHNFEG